MDPIQTKHFIPTDPIRTKFKTSIIFGPNSDAAYNCTALIHYKHNVFRTFSA
jgi:hypothetical protein